MEEEELDLPAIKDLLQLPVRFMLAYVVGLCEPLLKLHHDAVKLQSRMGPVYSFCEDHLSRADLVTRAQRFTPDERTGLRVEEQYIARAVDLSLYATFETVRVDEGAYLEIARLCHDAADNAAKAALTSGVEQDFERRARRQYVALMELRPRAEITGFGPAIDITRGRLVRPLAKSSKADPSLEVFLDPGNASKETIQQVLEALSELNRAAGGLGLQFSVEGLLTMAAEESLV